MRAETAPFRAAAAPALSDRDDLPTSAIELHLRAVSQLFRTDDPFPFRDSDLAREAEDYLAGRAKEVSKREPIRIIIYLESGEYARHVEADVAAKIGAGFEHLADAEANDIRELFRTGRRALLIGLAVLSACLLLAVRTAAAFGEGPVSSIVHESAVIFGWVAIWRPAEIFLYDWLPKARRRALLRRLSRARVSLRREPTAV